MVYPKYWDPKKGLRFRFNPKQVDSLVLLAAAGYPRTTPLPFAFRLMMSPAMTFVVERILPRSRVANGVRNSYGDPAKVTDAVVSVQCLIRQHGLSP